MKNSIRMVSVAAFLLAAMLLSTMMASAYNPTRAASPQFPVGSGSWNPSVPCSSPWIVRVTDITANMTGSSSLSSSIFNPGGPNKRWLTPGSTPPGWMSPGPPCTISNSQGTVSLFVEIDGVKREGLTNEDCSGTYDTSNGGGSNGGSFCDTTFNVFDPAIVPSSSSCTSSTDTKCYGKIHLEVDRDWKAAHYCGSSTACDDVALGSQTTSDSTLLDVQGYIYWDPQHLGDQWHSFNGWELHPFTAWRVHQTNPALSASFSFSPSAPSTGTQVSFTATSSGGKQPYSFAWNFGDGSTGTGSSTIHTYAAAGSYNVVLAVHDSSSPQQTVTSQQTVTVANPPPPLTTSFTFNPSAPSVGQTVAFTGSASGGTAPYSFSWSFGDGATGSGSQVSHVFSSGGSFAVQLSVIDSSGTTASSTKSVTVSPPPLSASFSSSPASPTTGQPVSFTGSAAGGTPPYTFNWVFGDGAIGTGNQVSHSYATAGTFTVQLTVQDSTGASASTSQSITVKQPAVLAADFTYSPTSVQTGTSVTFTATVSGGTSPYSCTWSFGDGVSTTGNPVSHSYTTSGSFTVQLLVTDSARTNATASHTIAVTQPPAPNFTITSNPSTIRISPGGSGTSTVTVTSTGGFSGTITFSTNISPSGPGITLSPSSVTLAAGGTTTATLTVTTQSSTSIGNYTATVTGNSTSLSHSATVLVTVKPSPDFSLVAGTSAISIPRSSSGTVTLSLASLNGFSGTVNLSVAVTSSGPKVSLSAPTITLTAGGSGNDVLTVRALKKTPVGSYTVTVTATSGTTTHTTTITVTVS